MTNSTKQGSASAHASSPATKSHCPAGAGLINNPQASEGSHTPPQACATPAHDPACQLPSAAQAAQLAEGYKHSIPVVRFGQGKNVTITSGSYPLSDDVANRLTIEVNGEPIVALTFATASHASDVLKALICQRPADPSSARSCGCQNWTRECNKRTGCHMTTRYINMRSDHPLTPNVLVGIDSEGGSHD